MSRLEKFGLLADCLISIMNTTSLIASKSPIMSGRSAVLHRDLHKDPYEVVEASGLYLTLSDGRRIMDASGGAAVSCIGHGDERVRQAIASQVTKLDYCHSLFFSCGPSETLSRALIDSTDGIMARVFIVNSGSEAMDAALKLARQYFMEPSPLQPRRTRFMIYVTGLTPLVGRMRVGDQFFS